MTERFEKKKLSTWQKFLRGCSLLEFASVVSMPWMILLLALAGAGGFFLLAAMFFLFFGLSLFLKACVPRCNLLAFVPFSKRNSQDMMIPS